MLVVVDTGLEKLVLLILVMVATALEVVILVLLLYDMLEVNKLQVVQLHL